MSHIPRRLGFFSRRERLRCMVQIGDVAAMSLAFMTATLLVGLERGAPPISEFLSMRLKLLNFLVFVGLLAIWHTGFRACGLYDPQRPLLASNRVADVVKAASLGVAALCLAALLFGIALVTPAFVACLWLLACAGLASLRVGLRAALAFAGGDALLRRNALIAGTGPRAVRLAEQLESESASDVRIVGFVDEAWWGIPAFCSGRPVVSDLRNLASFLRDHVVDEILLALPVSVLNAHRKELFAVCSEHGITMRFPASSLVDTDARDEIILSQYHGTIGGWPLCTKRALDLLLTLPLLALAVPLFALTALAIKISSPGPVLFAQERVGFNKRRFRMYKFRSMVCGAEARLDELEHLNETDGPTFKLTHDPRVTPIGRFLRTSSIDELPQLFNVLRGEMSLVGPRPLPVRDVERFELDRHRRRFSVLPGLTGLWQVSGRSSLPFDEWIELDLKYVDEWSLALDLKILLKTIPAVLLRNGAL